MVNTFAKIKQSTSSVIGKRGAFSQLEEDVVHNTNKPKMLQINPNKG